MRQNTPLEYRHLITIRSGKPKGRLRNALKVDPSEPSRRLSLSEQELEKAAKDYGEALVRYFCLQNHLVYGILFVAELVLGCES